MAEMMWSAVVQETVSRGISFVFGKREKKTPEAHIMDRLEMAVSDLELALERSAKMPITDVSLLQRRKKIKRAYVEAMELLDKHKQEDVPAGLEQSTQGVKRKRSWSFRAKNISAASSTALTTRDVRRFEWFAECASKFVRDVESGCSLRHHTFCNPIVRHLLEGKSLKYELEQGNQLRRLYISPTCSGERGVEAVLRYRYVDRTMVEKSFLLLMFVRLSESTGIVHIASKGLQLLTSQFKLAAESAMGELTLVPNLQCIVHSNANPLIDFQEQYSEITQHCRPDPTCCRTNQHGHCGSNIISSELPHIFTEEIIFWGFYCYISALDPSSSDEEGRRSIRRGWTSPLEVTFGFVPHSGREEPHGSGSYAVETFGNVKRRDSSSIQQVADTIKSDAINCLMRQPELTEYRTDWYSKHGVAGFHVEKPRIESTRRRNNTHGGTERSRRYLGPPCLLIRLQKVFQGSILHAFH